MYRWVDHTAELELQIEAASAADVFAEALAALAELASGDEETGHEAADRVTREVSVSAPDRAALLAEWLNELVYLSDAEAFIPERIERLELDERGLEATVSGFRGSPRPLVKAVTYHQLGMWEDHETWRARVIFDV